MLSIFKYSAPIFVNKYQFSTIFNPEIKVNFITPTKETITVEGKEGETLMLCAERNREKGINVPGTCEGQCVCATCHVYVSDKDMKKLKEPSEKEEDSLDSAWGMKENSRLACQIVLTKELDGLTVEIPKKTRNL